MKIIFAFRFRMEIRLAINLAMGLFVSTMWLSERGSAAAFWKPRAAVHFFGLHAAGDWELCVLGRSAGLSRLSR
ncbi:hypothetical protein BDA96_06G275700 [Sorghum bicolor]|uniref:Uncharacterized protein n=2 Tax=Sorghum bicolor TaxID=4558 RepID=A0A1B6PNU3_SORBI|nr:hypothetical protein BDA96_06G275700 [Sorghum bicolor]KXG27327.1 hypothetical protein SORBI_3006G252000 [Sorghum bicolor]